MNCNPTKKFAFYPGALRLIIAGSLIFIMLGAAAAQKSNLGKRVSGGGDAPKEESGGEKSSGSPSTSKSRKSRGAKPSGLRVTFVTDAPGTQVFINGNLLGMAGSDATLTKYLNRGYYVATTKQNGQVSQPRTIQVIPGSTSFNLSSNPNAAPPVRSVSTASAEEIVKRYLDPKQTDSVTTAEWQRLLNVSREGLAREPDNVQFKAQQLFAEGQLAFMRKDYTTARTAFNASALAQPDSALAFYGLGNAYLATNQPSEAVRAYQRALELNPEMAIAHKGMGDALTKMGKNKDALQSYERAREQGYSSTSTSLNTARNLMERKKWAEALRELEALSKSTPSADVFINMGECYEELKKPLSAAQAYRKATEIAPQSPLAHYKYGEIMYELREYAAAAEALERALTLDASGTTFKREKAREMADNAAEKVLKMK